jgi:AbrB family looped-hinge helix DNA binding protein
VYTAKLSKKGWIVIPKQFREKYGLTEGMRLQIVDAGNSLTLIPLPDDPVEALHGMLENGASLTADLLAEREQERLRDQDRNE